MTDVWHLLKGKKKVQVETIIIRHKASVMTTQQNPNHFKVINKHIKCAMLTHRELCFKKENVHKGLHLNHAFPHKPATRLTYDLSNPLWSFQTLAIWPWSLRREEAKLQKSEAEAPEDVGICWISISQMTYWLAWLTEASTKLIRSLTTYILNPVKQNQTYPGKTSSTLTQKSSLLTRQNTTTNPTLPKLPGCSLAIHPLTLLPHTHLAFLKELLQMYGRWVTTQPLCDIPNPSLIMVLSFAHYTSVCCCFLVFLAKSVILLVQTW